MGMLSSRKKKLSSKKADSLPTDLDTMYFNLKVGKVHLLEIDSSAEASE